MAGTERRHTAAHSSEGVRHSEHPPRERSSSRLYWADPHAVFSRDILKRQVETFKLAKMDFDPRLVLISTESQGDYRFRRDLLYSAMIRLQIPPVPYDDRNDYTRTYVTIDLKEIPLKLADAPSSPRTEPGVHEHRLVVFKNNAFDEDSFQGYINTMVDMANTQLVQNGKLPIPKT
jgi:hypothetical protein